MSSFTTNSPFGLMRQDASTKTKPTDFYLPSMYLNEEETKQENEKFSEFINNTVEGREFTQASQINDFFYEQVKDYYETKEDFFRASTSLVSNKTNEVLAGWRSDRTDEPVLSITVAGEGLQIFQPKKLAAGSIQTVDEFTFAGGSVFGALLDKEASVPQFTELLGRNAQSNHYAAIRARGGKQGELWTTAIANSTWLQGMLSETDSVKEALNSWIESSPTAFSVKGSIPFSAYAGDTMLDVLNDAPTPDDWNSEQAIEELKQADPKLATLLFTDLQVDPKRLAQLATNPLKFKYFIADAIDSHAYQTYLAEYRKQAGGWEQAYSIYAWPLVRDSFNSNDTFSELIVTGGAIALTATGVGAYVGIPILIGKVGEKIYRITKGAQRTFDVIESVSRRSGEIAKVNQLIWKSQQFIPSRLTDTMLDNWSVTKNLFDVPEGAGRLRRIGTYTGKQFVGEGVQGLVESGVLQTEAIMTGFQEEFSVKDMLYNGVEEGIGGIFLGGPLKAISYGSENLMTTKLGNRINTFIDAGKTILSNAVKISPQTSSNLDIAVRLIMGIPEDITIEDFEGAVERRLRLKDTLIRAQNITGIKGLLEDQVNEDDLVQATVKMLSGNDPSKSIPARVELVKRLEALMDRTMDPSTQKENVTAQDIEAFFYLTAVTAAGNNSAEVAKVTEALWLSRKRKEGITQKDGKPLTIKDATDEELKKLSEDMAEQTTLLATKLGAKDADEISKVFGSNLSDEDIEEVNSAVKEYENDQAESGSTEAEAIEYNLPAAGVFQTEVNPSKPQQTFNSDTFKMIARPGDTIKFIYNGGSTPGRERTIKLVQSPNSNQDYFVGIDTETNQERQFKYSRVDQTGITVQSSEFETTQTQTVTAPTKVEDFSLKSVVDGLLDNKGEVDENIDLTEEEKSDLLNRTCFRKDA